MTIPEPGRSLNPFTPTFGTSPALLVGRGPVIQEFADALDDGPGAPGRALLLSGQRGVGKTALLNALEDEAKSRGWISISETALSGLVDRFTTDHLPRLLSEHDQHGNTERRFSGFTAPGGLGGLRFETGPRHLATPSLRSQLTQLCDLLAPHGTGVLLTIDEISPETLKDLRAIAATVQHLFREDRPVAVVMAGLPQSVEALLDAPGVTFLRRALHHPLGAVSRIDARHGLAVPVIEAGKSWNEPALAQAVAATRGYPYMLQLVGFHAYRNAATVIEVADVQGAIERATRDVSSLVHRPTVSSLTAVEVAFLEAMAADDDLSATGDIAARMGKSAVYVGQYRRRLLDKHIITAPERGYVGLAMPGMREHLRGEVAGGGLEFW
ncbi:ATP-binding protein [Corynebacterium sp. A21]|uniref:ATP-binding protein n=1 Tax=Corynebacterium sp. A21 TaxID=3457318 RepID=UPI003FD43297